MRTRLLAAAVAVLAAAPARAMHLSDGILPASWAALWTLAALPFVALGLQRLERLGGEDLSAKPLVGLITAVVFVLSCLPIPVPTAGTCSHPCGTGIAAILLGPLVSVVVAAVALLIQALFLGHGGLTTWGADVLSMGVAGSFAAWAVFRAARSAGAGLAVAAFLAGLLADWATYGLTSLVLASGIRGAEPLFPLAGRIALAFVPTQLPLGVLEGALTAGMIIVLERRRPDLLARLGLVRAEEVR